MSGQFLEGDDDTLQMGEYFSRFVLVAIRGKTGDVGEQDREDYIYSSNPPEARLSRIGLKSAASSKPASTT